MFTFLAISALTVILLVAIIYMSLQFLKKKVHQSPRADKTKEEPVEFMSKEEGKGTLIDINDATTKGGLDNMKINSGGLDDQKNTGRDLEVQKQ